MRSQILPGKAPDSCRGRSSLILPGLPPGDPYGASLIMPGRAPEEAASSRSPSGGASSVARGAAPSSSSPSSSSRAPAQAQPSPSLLLKPNPKVASVRTEPRTPRPRTVSVRSSSLKARARIAAGASQPALREAQPSSSRLVPGQRPNYLRTPREAAARETKAQRSLAAPSPKVQAARTVKPSAGTAGPIRSLPATRTFWRNHFGLGAHASSVTRQQFMKAFLREFGRLLGTEVHTDDFLSFLSGDPDHSCALLQLNAVDAATAQHGGLAHTFLMLKDPAVVHRRAEMWAKRRREEADRHASVLQSAMLCAHQRILDHEQSIVDAALAVQRQAEQDDSDVKAAIQKWNLIDILERQDMTSTLFSISYNDAAALEEARLASLYLRQTPHLRVLELHFGGYGIHIDSLDILSKGIAANTTITCLDLSRNFMKSPATDCVARAVVNNTTITSLDLSHNYVDCTGAAGLAGMVRKNATLRSLLLAANCIDDQGAASIARALESNATLTLLDLIDNDQISAVGQADLKKARGHRCAVHLPDLQAHAVGLSVRQGSGARLRMN